MRRRPRRTSIAHSTMAAQAEVIPFRRCRLPALNSATKRNGRSEELLSKQQCFIDERQCLAQVVECARKSRLDLRVWNIMPASLDALYNASERQFCALQANEDEDDGVAARLAFLQKLVLGTLGIGEHRFHAKRDTPRSQIPAPRSATRAAS